MQGRWVFWAGLVSLIQVLSATAFAQNPNQVLRVDPNLPDYQKVAGLSGQITSVGSDTLSTMVTLLAEGFHDVYPNTLIQVEAKGSATAPPALQEGTAQVGAMSRLMKREEVATFERELGYPPLAVGVAIDAIAVFVNRENPIDAISIPELDAIFSKTRRLAYPESIRVWRQMDVFSHLGRYPIRAYGRNSASGTYGFFKMVALGNGDFRDSVKEQPGSSSVVMSVSEDPTGIGYSSLGYRTSGVKVLRLSASRDAMAFAPTDANVLRGDYPLRRMLYLYVVKPPDEPLPRIVTEFLNFALSRQGQELVVTSGSIPLSHSLAEEQRKLFLPSSGEMVP
jgi:phosphate transport system substrate-binding protein